MDASTPRGPGRFPVPRTRSKARSFLSDTAAGSPRASRGARRHALAVDAARLRLRRPMPISEVWMPAAGCIDERAAQGDRRSQMADARASAEPAALVDQVP